MLIIAHRGASGYVPEHTLIAKAMAHAMGADYLEQDLVATKDGQAVVLHDVHIDTVTNVADRFPTRRRDDGRFYAIDFTVKELRSLRVFERFDHQTGKAVFPRRYPKGEGDFRITTFDEEIRFIQNINQTTGRIAGVYPEIKQPAWHREQGCDLSAIVLKSLHRYGYSQPDSRCYLQCFDEFEVQRIRSELGYVGKLIQLIGRGHDELSGTDYNRLRTPEGLAALHGVVNGIGPAMDLVLSWDESGGAVKTDLVEEAHRFDMEVHPWTVRADQLPARCPSLDALMSALRSTRVDGVFTDHPDRV